MKRSAAALVAIILIGITQLLYCNAHTVCSENSFSGNLQASYFPTDTLFHPGDILATSYEFSCSGIITQWEAAVTGTGAHQIEFQVWHEASDAGWYNLVGSNLFRNASPTNGLLQLSVPEQDQITVSPGDFVGISTREGAEEDPFLIQRIVSVYINYNLTFRYISTPDELSLSTYGTVTPYPSEYPGSLGQYVGATPLINAVLRDTAGGPDRTTGNTPTVMTILEKTLTIATAVLGGLLVALLIFFSITILVICCCCVKKSAKKAIPPSTRELLMLPNTAYNNYGGPTMSENEAYNDTTGGSNDPYYSRITT